MKTYKVWVSVEEIDEEADTYENIGLPDWIAEFDAEADARVFVLGLLLVHAPQMIPTSDQVTPGVGLAPAES